MNIRDTHTSIYTHWHSFSVIYFKFVFFDILVLKTLDLKIYFLKIGFQETFERIHFTGEIVIFIKWKNISRGNSIFPGVYIKIFP